MSKAAEEPKPLLTAGKKWLHQNKPRGESFVAGWSSNLKIVRLLDNPVMLLCHVQL